MKTIIRLLMIAAIVSFVQGPLQTLRTNHPEAWKEGVSTLETIPKVVGQMLTREASWLSKANAQSPLSDQSNHSTVGATYPNKVESKTESPKKSSTNAPIAKYSSTPDKNQLHPSQPSASTKPGGKTDANSSSLSTLLDNPVQGLSEWVSGLPNGSNPLKHVKVTGLSKTEAGHLVSHVTHLNLITVLPKLEGLSKNYSELSKQHQSLTSTQKSAYVKLFKQSMTLLQLDASFYLDSANGKTQTPVTLRKLLNQPDLNKDQVMVSLKDAKTHQALATFTLQAKSPAQPV